MVNLVFGLMMQVVLVGDILYMASNSRNQALIISISSPVSIPENKPRLPMELQYTGIYHY